ncbi:MULTISPECIES: AAA family ATPase [unclassified Acinetobacter]|uniref:AAA family ATPase n=1 Tax=unclassified Acinetobacter TaxID=196816 RepID=UPI0015D17530|nr:MULTISPECIES: AAA family ATPase [unclassified Acinetobacter]
MKENKKIHLTPMSVVNNKKIDWLWRDWLPQGKLTLLAGPAGIGKTTLMIDIAASISRGGMLPFEEKISKQSNVLIYSTEDDIETTLNPRLVACGANIKNVYYISGIQASGDKVQYFDPTKDFKFLEETMLEKPNIRLIIIDPIVSVVSGDMHKSNEVRNSLAAFVELAQKYNCAIVGITHFSKSNLQTSPVDKIIGSQAFTALARMVWVVAEKKGEKFLAKAKSNISTLEGAIFYEIEKVIIDSDIETTRTRWTRYDENSNYEELMLSNSNEKNASKDSTVSRAQALILDYLNQEDVIESKKLEKLIIDTNKISQSTYRRALKLLQSESKIETIKKKEWYWKLTAE